KIAELIGDRLPDTAIPTRERLAELQQHARALKEAVAVLEGRISQERLAASALVCDQVSEEHRRRAREISLRLLDVREAMLGYVKLVDLLNSEDIAWSHIGPAQVLALGDPHDRQSRLALYLRQMAEAGHLDATEIPEAIR